MQYFINFHCSPLCIQSSALFWIVIRNCITHFIKLNKHSKRHSMKLLKMSMGCRETKCANLHIRYDLHGFSISRVDTGTWRTLMALCVQHLAILSTMWHQLNGRCIFHLHINKSEQSNLRFALIWFKDNILDDINASSGPLIIRCGILNATRIWIWTLPFACRRHTRARAYTHIT